jgi:pimeloyl-ACP methyl ester carboxylesterase
LQIPDTRYAKSGDVNIAYQVLGEGQFDVVFIPPSITHVELGWNWARHARMLEGLADFSRLILFDKRGMGLSDRVATSTTFEQRMDDIRAVMDAAGSGQAALFGLSEGASMAMLFAATYPARASALAIYGGVVRQQWAPDFPFGHRDGHAEESLDEEERNWGRPAWIREVARSMTPDADDEELQALVTVLRYGATPGAITDLNRLNSAIDVRPALPAIRAPTLVLHQTDDPWVSIEQGRFAAQHIRDARLLELPGETHVPLAAEVGPIVEHVRSFFEEVWSGGWAASEPDRVLATVLFTDLVDSTMRAAELGDRAWRELLERHHGLVRRELVRFRVTEDDTAGDGFFASFDGPARAIRCACAVRDSLAATAGPGEVLVSQTVKDLVAGSGIGFEDRGAADLKGVPGEWKLYAVADAAS